ncbi:eukaryotic mitochondrial regulator protein-domain-containing protein [Dactylonectria estremocensis]|uniref:Eukaryotic mitochondrial regulator protein-domain-containing protein n=1 Tax=Dactylonectria estremocensis TaxID=1079267 RepID=A0A9P9JF76_9HYPO|nr:eukaryotic mitochondrial regulator protein-domain-containing protein [Dactylonectria estremocensis]
MPPRVRVPSVPLAGLDASSSFTKAAPFARTFSTTPCREKMSKGRQMMYDWLKTNSGANLAEAPNSPNYLGPFSDQPFPLNPLFRSQPVLDDTSRELIWEKVTVRGDSIKSVSAEMGVDVRRVAAVVRLKEVEKQWITTGKKLATPYAKAVMKMLPKTSIREGEENEPHEPVNEVQVHNLTMQQLFVPVSESRHFTREDAATAFHDRVLSADVRSPQPQLISMERDILNGSTQADSLEKFKQATQAEEETVAKKLEKQRVWERKQTRRVFKKGKTRVQFRFKTINVDDAGRDGRSRNGTGWRYGAPFEDRKRGLVKIPTSVP